MNGIRRDWPAIKENARSKHHDFEYHSDGESHSEYEVARAVPAAAVPAAAVPAAARKRMTFVGFLLNFADAMMKHLKLSKQCFHSWWTYHVIAFNEWMTCNRLLPRRQLLVPVVSWMPLHNKQLTTWVHGASLVFSLLRPAVQSFPNMCGIGCIH